MDNGSKVILAFVLTMCAVAVMAVLVLVWAFIPSEAQLKEQAYRINDKLPESCRFLDLGEYNGADVYVIVCDGTPTTSRTSSRLVSTGKTVVRKTEHTFVVGAW